jgi:hypothetical protein
LFFTSDSPFKCAEHVDRPLQLRRQVVDRIAAAQVRARDQFKVGEIDVQLVAIFEVERVARWHRPVRVFPQNGVERSPAKRAVLETDAHVDIAIGVHAQRAQYVELGIPIRGEVPLFELRFLHPPGAVAWSTQTFVRWRVTLREAKLRADIAPAAEPASVRTGHVFRGLLQAEFGGAPIDGRHSAPEPARDLGSRRLRVKATHLRQIALGPLAAVHHSHL